MDTFKQAVKSFSRRTYLAMLSRCSVVLCCMCFTAALTLASGCPKLELRGAEDARACPLGSTLAATGTTCSGNRAGIMFLH
jgi:hypothetical protein